MLLPLRTRADCLAAGAYAKAQANLYGWPDDQAHELELLVMELATNAVRHAKGGEYALWVNATEANVRVEDRGLGYSESVLQDGGRTDGLCATGAKPTHTLSTGGLGSGLACARRLSDKLQLENRTDGGARALARRIRKS